MQQPKNSVDDLRPIGTIFKNKGVFRWGGDDNQDMIYEWKITEHVLRDTPDGLMWLEHVELISSRLPEPEDTLVGVWDQPFMITTNATPDTEWGTEEKEWEPPACGRGYPDLEEQV